MGGMQLGRQENDDDPRPRRLTRTAFYDAPLFVTSLSVVKNFVLVGDAHKGCRFVHSINGVKNLIELSKDFDAADVAGVGFAVCGRRLSLVSVDRVGAVRVAAYDASHPGSWRGKRLIPLAAVRGADFSATVVLSQRLTRGVFGGGGAGSSAQPPPRTQAALLLRVDGGISAVAPLWQTPEALRRLRALSASCSLALPQPAGLNPAAWRRSWACVPRALGGGLPWGRPAAAGSAAHVRSPGGAFVDLDQLARLVSGGDACFAPSASARERAAVRAGVGVELALEEAREAVEGVMVW
jgi:hypothetical protein